MAPSEGDVKRTFAAMAGGGGLEADHQGTELRQPEPKRHHAFEHAALGKRVAASRALASNDQDHPGAPRLPAFEEVQQRAMGFALGKAVQIEPTID